MHFWNIVKIIALIVVLALLGFNIFTYLAKGTDVFGKYLGFAEKKIERGTKKTLKFLGKETNKVGKAVVGGVKKTGKEVRRGASAVVSPLAKAVDGGASRQHGRRGRHKRGVAPDSAGESEIQRKPHKGYCYIGSWQGIRSCIEVKKAKECMSGQLFPTRAICVDPKLRQ
jgi:hypothetical protein